jgi:hypothetical protein
METRRHASHHLSTKTPDCTENQAPDTPRLEGVNTTPVESASGQYDLATDATSPLTRQDQRPRLSSSECLRTLDELLAVLKPGDPITARTRTFLLFYKAKVIEQECEHDVTCRVSVSVARILRSTNDGLTANVNTAECLTSYSGVTANVQLDTR